MRTPPDTFLQNVFAYRDFGGWYNEAHRRIDYINVEKVQFIYITNLANKSNYINK